jgi:hypothetical protein
MLTRRHILVAAAATLAAPLAPRRLWAASTLTMGEVRIDTLSDGNLVLPGDFILGGMPQDEMQAIVARYGLPTDQLTPPCNVTLLRDGTNTVLFDAGSGPDFQPTAGKLSEAMDAHRAECRGGHPCAVHPRPSRSPVGASGRIRRAGLPEAQYMIGQAEFDYWMNPDTVATIGEARTSFAVGAARRLAVIADSVRLLSDGEEPLPGIAARLTPGHTPGHMAYEIAGSTPAMVLGDCIGNHHVAFERPGWASGSDQDKDLAAATRVALLERLAAERHAIVGFHLPGGGIGRVEPADAGYRFIEDV